MVTGTAITAMKTASEMLTTAFAPSKMPNSISAKHFISFASVFS